VQPRAQAATSTHERQRVDAVEGTVLLFQQENRANGASLLALLRLRARIS
jgi:hypothetical protein